MFLSCVPDVDGKIHPETVTRLAECWCGIPCPLCNTNIFHLFCPYVGLLKTNGGSLNSWKVQKQVYNCLPSLKRHIQSKCLPPCTFLSKVYTCVFSVSGEGADVRLFRDERADGWERVCSVPETGVPRDRHMQSGPRAWFIFFFT